MKPPETRSEIFAGEGPNGEDLIKTIDGKTGAITNVEMITTDADGKEIKVPLSSKKMSGMVPVEAPKTAKSVALPTVEDMIHLAEEMKAGATRAEITNFVGTILEKCKEHVLEGCYDELFPEESVKAETIVAIVKYLKDLGYKVKKTPTPGEGTWIKISWPTSLKKSQKTTTTAVQSPAVRPQPMEQKPRKKHLLNQPDMEMALDFKEKKTSS